MKWSFRKSLRAFVLALSVVGFVLFEQFPQFAKTGISWPLPDTGQLTGASSQMESNLIFVQGKGSGKGNQAIIDSPKENSKGSKNGCNAGGKDDVNGCDPGNSAGKNCGGDETLPDKCKKKPGLGGGTGSGDASGTTSSNVSEAREKGKGASLLVQAINFGYIYPAFVEPTLIAPGELVQIHFRTYVKNFQQFFKLECRDLLGQEIFLVGTHIGEIVGCGSSMLTIRTSPELRDGQVSMTIQGLKGYSFSLSICSMCTNSLSEIEAEQALILGHVPLNLILFFENELSDVEQIKIILAEHDLEDTFAQVYQTVPGYVQLFLPEQSVSNLEELKAKLEADPRISAVFFENLLTPSQVSDPYFAQQLHLKHLNLPQGWDMYFKQRGSGIVVGVLDSGIDFDGSPEEFIFPGCAPLGYDLSTAYPAPDAARSSLAGLDNIGHGTAVAALAGAANNSAQGVGVAPGVLLVSLKVFSRVGQSNTITGTLDDVAKALQMAYQMGVDVVNMSIGCQNCDEQTEAHNLAFYGELFDRLAQGVSDELIFSSECTVNFEQKRRTPIIVAAAGNDGSPHLDSPAILPETISVGSVGIASDGSITRSTFSNYGPGLDFMAEGENLLTTNLEGAFGNSQVSGTSFSAPQVAGLVALILSQEPSLSLEDVRNRIINCFVQDLGATGWDEQTGYGRIRFPSPEEAPEPCLPS